MSATRAGLHVMQADERLLLRLGAAALAAHVGLLVLLHLGGLAAWRLGALVASVAVFMSAQRAVKNHIVRCGDTDRGFSMLAGLGQVFTLIQMSLTGGLHSPFIAALPLGVALPMLMFGPHEMGLRLAGSLALGVAAVAALPEAITGAPITTWHHEAAAVVVFVWAVSMLRFMVSKLARAAHDATCAIDRLREERVEIAEAQTRRLQQVGSRVAHELKNPLAAIKGLVQLVARGAADDKARERLDVVQTEVARMEAILRDYLTFARPLETLEPEPIDVAEIARDAAAVVAGRAETARLTIAVRAVATPTIADPRRLKEALLNLLANAIEATPAGGRIELATRLDGDAAVITVADTGRGIAPEHLARLGTSFFTTRDDGTGLGVVLAQGVVHQHGGAIEWSSAPGRGTTVTIRLPRQAAEVAA